MTDIARWEPPSTISNVSIPPTDEAKKLYRKCFADCLGDLKERDATRRALVTIAHADSETVASLRSCIREGSL